MAEPAAVLRAARLEGRTPTRPDTAITSANARAKHSDNWPSSPITEISSLLALLPAAAALQGFDHFRRHVFLIMLGQHFTGNERAVRVHGAGGDHALAFAKQRRQHAVIIGQDTALAIGDAEPHFRPRAMLKAALFHQPAQPKGNALTDLFCRHVAGTAEIHGV